MIKGDTNTAFKLSKFRVTNLSFSEADKNHKGYDFIFDPSGLYDKKTGVFELLINFRAFEENTEKSIIDVRAIAEFKFDGNIEFKDIPPHFYTNSIPIVFPYIRAFVSTLTLQANSQVLMLGLMNFTGMAQTLIENSKPLK